MSPWKKISFFAKTLWRTLRHDGEQKRYGNLRDDLTGLLTLKAARLLIPPWIKKSGANFFLVFADIDYFKSINDCHSHESGDIVLLAFATIASEFFGDHVFRVGGEEFLLCLEGSEKKALTLCEDFRRAVETRVQGTANGLIRERAFLREVTDEAVIHYPVTVSQGIARAFSGIDFTELKSRADGALFRAKDLGRNRVVIGNRTLSAGESPIHYTRRLLGSLHQQAREKGFACWWEMEKTISSREKHRIIRTHWNWMRDGELLLSGGFRKL